MKRRREMRNTPTERLCPACQGAGEIVRNDSNPHGYGPDPQDETAEPCAKCVAGWVRWTPWDPLETLRAERRQRMSLKRYQGAAEDQLRRSAEAYYQRSRRIAFAPVRLP